MVPTNVKENKENIVLGDINCDYLKRSDQPGIKSVFTRHGLEEKVNPKKTATSIVRKRLQEVCMTI